jgi:hypothetical protein
MKKMLFLLVLAIGVSLFAYYSLFRVESDFLKYQPQDVSSDEKVAEESTNKKPFSGTGSLTSLREIGDDIECNVSYKNYSDDSVIEGTYFTSDKDMRVDLLVPSPDLEGLILSSIIIKDDMFYSWAEIDGGMYGVKTTLADGRDDVAFEQIPVAMDAQISYTCKPWTNVDRTVFETPSSVLFRDQEDVIKSGLEDAIIYEGGVELP